MRDISLALQEHRQKILFELQVQESQILGVFLYGSQNYGLSTKNSDVDTIAIVLPNEYDLYFSQPITKELHLDNGEHCVVKDIREIFKEFKKQNVNFLEILVTDYKWLNPLYENMWNMFTFAWTEHIVRYDIERAVKSICGQALHTIAQGKVTLDGKKYMNVFRMQIYLDNYLFRPISFKECIQIQDEELKDMLISYKKGLATPSVKDFEDLEAIIIHTRDNFKMKKNINKSTIDVILDGTAFRCIKKCVKLNPYS